MRIALLSDIHGFLPQIDSNNIDCLLIAGDICPDYSNFHKQGTWIRMGFLPWLEQFKEVKFIGGNHDFYLDIVGCNHQDYLCNELCLIGKSLTVYGFPYTMCPKWAFEKTEEEIEILLTKEKKPDIMLCHNPPFGICDRVDSFGHIGSMSIRNYLLDQKPKFCIFGHIHEGYGTYQLGETLCINCSFADRRRDYRMQYLILDTETKLIEIVKCKEWTYD